MSSTYDVLVCSLGYKPMIKEKLSIVKDLWSAGVKADVMYDTSQVLSVNLIANSGINDKSETLSIYFFFTFITLNMIELLCTGKFICY